MFLTGHAKLPSDDSGPKKVRMEEEPNDVELSFLSSHPSVL